MYTYTMDKIKPIIITLIAFFSDEELLGLRLEELTKKIVIPFVAAYVVGQMAYEQIKKIEAFIEPRTPDFTLN